MTLKLVKERKKNVIWTHRWNLNSSLCDERPVPQKQMCNAEDKNYNSVLRVVLLVNTYCYTSRQIQMPIQKPTIPIKLTHWKLHCFKWSLYLHQSKIAGALISLSHLTKVTRHENTKYFSLTMQSVYTVLSFVTTLAISCDSYGRARLSNIRPFNVTYCKPFGAAFLLEWSILGIKKYGINSLG